MKLQVSCTLEFFYIPVIYIIYIYILYIYIYVKNEIVPKSGILTINFESYYLINCSEKRSLEAMKSMSRKFQSWNAPEVNQKQNIST